MKKIAIISLTILSINLYCSESNEYIEIEITSSSEKIIENNTYTKEPLCWKNDWYVLSAMCLSGAAGVTGAITATPSFIFNNYTTAGIYAGITTASITAIWTVPQVFYHCYKGCKYLRRQCDNKHLQL